MAGNLPDPEALPAGPSLSDGPPTSQDRVAGWRQCLARAANPGVRVGAHAERAFLAHLPCPAYRLNGAILQQRGAYGGTRLFPTFDCDVARPLPDGA
jgi:hypothetical protein